MEENKEAENSLKIDKNTVPENTAEVPANEDLVETEVIELEVQNDQTSNVAVTAEKITKKVNKKNVKKAKKMSSKSEEKEKKAKAKEKQKEKDKKAKKKKKEKAKKEKAKKKLKEKQAKKKAVAKKKKAKKAKKK